VIHFNTRHTHHTLKAFFVNFINKVSITYLANKTGKEIWDLFLSWMCPEGLKLLRATNRTGEVLKYKEESDEPEDNEDIDWDAELDEPPSFFDDDPIDLLGVSNDTYSTINSNGNIFIIPQPNTTWMSGFTNSTFNSVDIVDNDEEENLF